MPVYNGERHLAAALDSVLGQTFTDFELIICDNASTDRTGEIAQSYAAKDPRVRYVRNVRNVGAARNFRRTFELSSGEYFRWHAADDVSSPECQARCVEAIERDPRAVLAYPKTRFMDEQGRLLWDYDDGLHLQSAPAGQRFRQILERLGYVNLHYGLMRADVLRKTRLLGTYGGSDIVFLAELSLYGPFCEVPEFLFYRRLHPAASSAMTLAQLGAFYDPDNRSHIWIQEWRHLWEHLRSVLRAPLGIRDKLLMQAFLVRVAAGNSGKLARELLGAAAICLPVFRGKRS
jgi:glycosyltransferase involved in cell wall biosynthesis